MVVAIRSRSLRVVPALVVALGTVVAVAGPARAAVLEEKGIASGVSTSVSIFNGPFSEAPAPTVSLPPGGSVNPITSSVAARNVQFGPAVLFTSGQQTVSTQGSTGAGGSVSSSTNITSINTSGLEVLTAASASSTCSATEGGRSGTVTFTNGTVRVSEGDPDVDGDDVLVPILQSPAPNTVIHGVIEGTGDSFDIVINEQIVYADGTISVTAAHEKLIGPSAIGDIHVGQVICGVTPGGRYTPLPPARIFDSRPNAGIGPGMARDIQVTGLGGVPATGVSAVVMNVTVTQPTAAGFLTLFPSGGGLPVASNLGFTPGQTVPNLVVVKVGANGKVTTYNSAGNTHVIFDVAGWYSDTATGNDGRYRPVVPARLLDTRDPGGVRLGPGGSLNLQVTGRGGVPASGVSAAVLNVVATGTTATSFVTVYPAGSAMPDVSNLNFNSGETVSNRVMVKLGNLGQVTIYNLAGGTDIVVDVSGWYTDGTSAATLGTFVPLTPERILDTRTTIGGINGARLAGSGVDVPITGRGGVPTSGVSAVILNVTVTQPAAPGFLTVFPAGGNLPQASDLTYNAGETRPNLVVVQVGAGGKVTLYVSAQSHVIFDVAGFFW